MAITRALHLSVGGCLCLPAIDRPIARPRNTSNLGLYIFTRIDRPHSRHSFTFIAIIALVNTAEIPSHAILYFIARRSPVCSSIAISEQDQSNTTIAIAMGLFHRPFYNTTAQGCVWRTSVSSVSSELYTNNNKNCSSAIKTNKQMHFLESASHIECNYMHRLHVNCPPNNTKNSFRRSRRRSLLLLLLPSVYFSKNRPLLCTLFCFLLYPPPSSTTPP